MRKLLLNPTPLFRKLRQLSMLLTLLLALPQTAMGATETVTKTITLNKSVSETNFPEGQNLTWGSITLPVTITENSITYDGQITIESASISSYSSDTNGAVFKMKGDNASNSEFHLEVPGNYPAIPSQVTVETAYANASGNTQGAYFSVELDGSLDNGNTYDYQSTSTSLPNTTVTFTADGNPRTNRSSEGTFDIWFTIGANWDLTTQTQTTVTVKEITITYERDTYGLTIGNTVVKSDNRTDVLGDGKVSYVHDATNNSGTLTLNGASITSTSTPAIESSLGSLTVKLAGTNTINCGSNNAFNLAANSGLNFAADGTSPGQLTITSTSSITTESFYSPSTATVTYTDLMATNPTSTSVLISPPTSYGITVAGTRVTAQNANNILNDGKVTYTHNNDGTGTLTLNGASLTDKIRVSRSEALTIELIGENSIRSDSSAIKADFGTTQTPPTPNLIFKGEGHVTLTPGSTYPAIGGFNVDITTNGMYAHGSLTTNGTFGIIAKKYDITVANTQVSSYNKDNVMDNASFTPASTGNNNTNTLKLNGVIAGGAIVSNLDELTIEFIGENQVPYISSTNTSAPLTIIGLTDAQTPTSTLDLNSADSNISAVNGFASVALDGAYMKTDHGCSYISENTRGYMQTPGSVNHLVNKMTFTTAHYYPLWIGGTTQVCDDNINDIFDDTAKSATNPITASFAPSSNTLSLNGLSIDSEFGIESGLSSLIINLKGDNSINTNTAYYYNPIYSHIATAPLTIQKEEGATNAELRLSSSSSNPQVIRGFASVSHTGLNFASKTGSSLDNSATKDAILTSATIYPLWVGGTLVTGTTTSGTDASSGSTVWEYDATNNKLTLTNYNKTDNDGHAFISNMANLNVYLVGTNTVGKQALSTGKAFYTTYTDATLTFSTDENNKGTLSASGYDIFCEGFRTVNGIYCNNGLGYYPSSREIKAKATPTISFSKRQQTGDTNPGNIISPSEAVGETETLTTTYGSAFYAPAPTFSNGEVLSDSTRFEYSYSVDGVVEFPNNGEDANNPGKIKYGEISLLKAGTVTITCTFPGNMQNNPCSASYTLQVNKADAAFQYVDGNSQTITTGNGFIDVDGTSKWGTPEAIGEEPTLSKPDDATAITYTSSNNDVATVSTTGVVTPKGAGSATITATIKDDERYNDATASYTLTVMVPATISFANATASIVNTETYTQTASTVPAGSTITYSSSNNDVNVNANGEVTISNSFYGKATITATVTAVPDADPQYYYVLPDNTAFQATYDLTVSKVFNSVTFEDGQNFATYYNESENMTVPEGLTAYLITGTSDNSVVTYPINYLPQNVPLLLEKSGTAGSTLTNTIYSGTELTDAERSSNILQYAEGDLDITSALGGTPYILYKNEFVKASGTILQNHCYLLITNPAPTRGYYSIGNGNDGSTAIDDTLIDNEETTNDDWYDLQGRRIQKPTKAGIYIVNGKKMIVK